MATNKIHKINNLLIASVYLLIMNCNGNRFFFGDLVIALDNCSITIDFSNK